MWLWSANCNVLTACSCRCYIHIYTHFISWFQDTECHLQCGSKDLPKGRPEFRVTMSWYVFYGRYFRIARGKDWSVQRTLRNSTQSSSNVRDHIRANAWGSKKKSPINSDLSVKNTRSVSGTWDFSVSYMNFILILILPTTATDFNIIFSAPQPHHVVQIIDVRDIYSITMILFIIIMETDMVYETTVNLNHLTRLICFKMYCGTESADIRTPFNCSISK